MARIVRFDPFRDFRRIMWSNFPFEGEWEEDSFSEGLNVDVYETEGDVVVETDLPGVAPEDVDLSVTSDSVTIKAKREEKVEEKKKEYVRRERRFGAYARTVSLPVPVIPDKAEAHFEDGTLKLVVPKEKSTEPKQVQVKVEKKES